MQRWIKGTVIVSHGRLAGKGSLFYLLCRVSYNQHPPGDSGLRHMGTAHALFI